MNKRNTKQIAEAIRKYEGNIYHTRVNGDFKVLKYHDKKHLDIIFINTGYRKTINATETKRGVVKDPLCKNVYGIGFSGIGKYTTQTKNKKNTYSNCWHDMMDRCYRDCNDHDKTYKNRITVCEEWHNFQNFARWYEDNYPKKIIGDKRYQLDKDLLIKDNTIYSPFSCCFLPGIINSALLSKKGYWITVAGNYLVNISEYGSRRNFGTYKTEEEAIEVYRKNRKIYLKDLAIKYKSTISKRAYEALINYKF